MTVEIVVPPPPKHWLLQKSLLLAGLLFCIAYGVAATRNYRAARLFTEGEVARARVLEPSDAEYPYIEGLQTMQAADPPSAFNAYREALRLNPRMPGAWLDYAYALRAMGQTNESLDALSRALATSPSQPEVVFEAASAKLAAGDRNQAFLLFRRLLEGSPEHSAEIVELCWRASPNPEELASRLLGSNAAAYYQFLEFLHRRGQTKPAEDMFQQYLASQAPFHPQLVGAHVDYLLQKHEVDAAVTAWDAAARRFPNLAQYHQANNLVSNPGFEQELLDGGFGWRIAAQQDIAIVVDSAHVAAGDHSLAVIFDGTQAQDFGLAQSVPVEAGHSYSLSFVSMSKDLGLEASPRITVRDAYSREELTQSKELGASDDWHKETLRFVTGPSTRLVEIRLDRRPSSRELSGKLWLDEFVMQ